MPCGEEAMAQRPSHIALLGDSIFANLAYTSGEPDVVSHLRRVLPPPWQATLLAQDGATTSGLERQLHSVPADASHLVISVGGNDALQNADLLSMRVATTAQALELFAARLASFEATYRAGIQRAASLGRSTFVCTVYNGALDADRATAARMGLTLFNDAILRTAASLGLDTLELRSVCTEHTDYANPIEPSGAGGLKIARAVASMVGALPGAASPSRIWTQV
jgi:hypothetical protein